MSALWSGPGPFRVLLTFSLINANESELASLIIITTSTIADTPSFRANRTARGVNRRTNSRAISTKMLLTTSSVGWGWGEAWVGSNG